MDLLVRDVDTGDGRVVRAHDAAPGRDDLLPVLWHHGTPGLGNPPAPLAGAARRLGVRWIGVDRPGYGGSTARPGRSVADVADDAAVVADALGLGAFAVVGHSGGGPHALGCAARYPDRVLAAVEVAGAAPLDARGLDWYADLNPVAAASFRATGQGREARRRLEENRPPVAPPFTEADEAALAGPWSWFLEVVATAVESGPEPVWDDEAALVASWGVDLGAIRCPTLVVHGEDDRAVPPTHGRWLGDAIPGATTWIAPGDGHVSVLRHAEPALEWLVRAARVTRRGEAPPGPRPAGG